MPFKSQILCFGIPSIYTFHFMLKEILYGNLILKLYNDRNCNFQL